MQAVMTSWEIACHNLAFQINVKHVLRLSGLLREQKADLRMTESPHMSVTGTSTMETSMQLVDIAQMILPPYPW